MDSNDTNQQKDFIVIQCPDGFNIRISNERCQSATMQKLTGKTLTLEEFLANATSKAIKSVFRVYANAMARNTSSQKTNENQTVALTPDQVMRLFGHFDITGVPADKVEVRQVKRSGYTKYLFQTLPSAWFLAVRAGVTNTEGWTFGTSNGKIVISQRQ